MTKPSITFRDYQWAMHVARINAAEQAAREGSAHDAVAAVADFTAGGLQLTDGRTFRAPGGGFFVAYGIIESLYESLGQEVPNPVQLHVLLNRREIYPKARLMQMDQHQAPDLTAVMDFVAELETAAFDLVDSIPPADLPRVAAWVKVRLFGESGQNPPAAEPGPPAPGTSAKAEPAMESAGS